MALTTESNDQHETYEQALTLAARVAQRLRSILDDMTPQQLTIVQGRLIHEPPVTLAEIGRRVRFTRERVRQIEFKMKQNIDAELGKDLRTLALTLHRHFGPMMVADELDQRLRKTVPDEGELVYPLLRRCLLRSMEFRLINGVYLDSSAVELLSFLRRRAGELADNLGLVRESELIKSLPDKQWQLFWPWLRERSGLHTFHGVMSFRDSAPTRAKAALMFIGRCATREEIQALCNHEVRRVGAALSRIPDVVRIDKNRWGLREWVDEEYNGIVSEIIKSIEAGGGRAEVKRLLTEMPQKFNVNVNSVRAFMSTQRFKVDHGFISLASVESIEFQNFDDVIDGRDEHGAPYWTFVVEQRYFKGYSVLRVPPEFAKALGCEPDSGLDVRINNLPHCRKLSLRWSLSSITGASLGYVAEPLRQLGLQSGERVRVTIKGQSLVDFSAAGQNIR